MPKKNKGFLKKQLHPNRYFIWAIILLFVAFALLVSYIALSDQAIDSTFVFPDVKAEKTYADDVSHFSVAYPNNWVLEKDQNGTTIFENPDNVQESISVAVTKTSNEGIIRHSLNITKEQDFSKNGNWYALIQAGTAKDNSPISVALVKSSKSLYYISGHSASFNAFVLNFKTY